MTLTRITFEIKIKTMLKMISTMKSIILQIDKNIDNEDNDNKDEEDDMIYVAVLLYFLCVCKNLYEFLNIINFMNCINTNYGFVFIARMIQLAQFYCFVLYALLIKGR
eukprot:TRINITY_DN5780_c0_g1_i2.p3 TRINITY_DN5780_c0_g1~~TRINITY_DN5780_c0_g1_i2.p3  ORF type:complete len:108 (-),score=6.70 TRINITY_DN5780_c0_g1_i2:170-493(-)